MALKVCRRAFECYALGKLDYEWNNNNNNESEEKKTHPKPNKLFNKKNFTLA